MVESDQERTPTEGQPPEGKQRAQRFVEFLRNWGDSSSLAGFLVLVVLAVLHNWPIPVPDCVLGFLVVILLVFAGVMTLVTLSSLRRAETPPPSDAGPRAATPDMRRWISPVILVVLLMYLGFRRTYPAAVTEPLALALGIILFISVILVVWFIDVFCQTVSPGTVAQEKEILPMVRFCYVFTVAAIALSFLPLLGILLMNTDLYIALVRSPIGLVKGCVHYPKDLQWELACADNDPYKAQWIINLGGSARFTNAMPPSPSATPTMAPPDQWIRSDSFRPTVVLHGGLVVPWYFISLALMGAAVSLVRKVPEYQRRAISAQDSLDAPTAREYLAFQIFQVVSAPLIAIAAYDLVAPNSLSASAALGFASGFSSEAVLLAIRKLSDTITGTPTEAPVSGTDDPAIVDAVTALLFRDPDLRKWEPELKVSDIEITSQNGVVTLSGKLSKDDSIKRAVDLAKHAAGVKGVNDKGLTKKS